MFVLAHLSDPHLAPLPTPRPWELVNKRITGFLNWHAKRRHIHRSESLAALVEDLKAQPFDYIAVTGDLVNISLRAEYAPARAWLDRLGSPDNVTVIPGNHDVYVAAGRRHIKQYWSEFMRGDDAAEVEFPFVRRRGSIALIGLSTAVPTAPFMATGWLGDEQLKRLSDVLATLGREGAYRIVLIHHPPVSQALETKRLTDAQAFCDVLAAHGAELVLHGHDHVRALVWLDGSRGKIPLVGVPSASASFGITHDPAAYNLYAIDGAPGAWRCEMVTRGPPAMGSEFAELNREMLVAPESAMA